MICFRASGAFSLGLERTGGFETVAFCEIDPVCRRVLAKHWPSVPCHDDVTTYDFKEGEADVITAGFPCQDISFAGAGAGLAGARSGLYREVIRAVCVVRPLYAVLENVAALLGRGLDTILGDLAEVGYDAEWHCIPASAVGAPHRRDRIWIVANPGGEQHEGGCAPLSGTLAAELSRAGADASGERCVEARELRCEQPSEWPSSFCEELAYANSEGLSFARPEQDGSDRQHGRRMPAPGGWWATEPDVGGMVDGFSKELDGALDAQELYAEAGTEDESDADGMSGLRRDGGPTEASSRLLQAGSSANPLRPLPCEGGQEGWPQASEIGETVQGLRAGFHAVSQQETQHLQPRVSFGAWPHERDEALGSIWQVEPNVPRVASGVKHRVDRLAELGNAVVPQVVEIIGRAILKARAA